MRKRLCPIFIFTRYRRRVIPGSIKGGASHGVKRRIPGIRPRPAGRRAGGLASEDDGRVSALCVGQALRRRLRRPLSGEEHGVLARCSRCPPCPTRALRRCCSWTWRTKPPCAPSWRACFRSCPSRGSAGRRFPRVCISSPASITRACSYGDCAITTLRNRSSPRTPPGDLLGRLRVPYAAGMALTTRRPAPRFPYERWWAAWSWPYRPARRNPT